MDRFEAFKVILVSSFFIIYIPVWIDLKERNSDKHFADVAYLHSSMDRFEAYNVEDLKRKFKKFTFQYG